MRAIILAGGFGTRLRPLIGDDMPKCLAPVRGRPMVNWVINNMKSQGINDITLALHYKAELLMQRYGNKLKYVVEEEPLGTGGAVKNCLRHDEPSPVLVSNGDTICPMNYFDMLDNHCRELTIAVDPAGRSAGVYIITPSLFDKFSRRSFSFEKDVIPYVTFSRYTVPHFTDYGTPETYSKAHKDWV